MFNKQQIKFRELLWSLKILKNCPVCGNKDLKQHGFDNFLFTQRYSCDVCEWGKK